EQERRRLMERREEGGEMRKGLSENDARMEVYKMACDRIPSDVLLRMMQKRVPDAANYYLMRKSLVTEWAVQAGLEFAFHLTPAIPSTILLDFGTGRSSNVICKMNLNRGASNDERIVPFRVSQSMDRFMGFT
ncbi:hypothetical protein PENTCL1PPCAC_25521, partial [Pristionchus entomophagus]